MWKPADDPPNHERQVVALVSRDGHDRPEPAFYDLDKEEWNKPVTAWKETDW